MNDYHSGLSDYLKHRQDALANSRNFMSGGQVRAKRWGGFSWGKVKAGAKM